jgi:hypothetical protein
MRPHLQNSQSKMDWAQMVESLLCMCEALSINSSHFNNLQKEKSTNI